jgi:hypothetical protein
MLAGTTTATRKPAAITIGTSTVINGALARHPRAADWHRRTDRRIGRSAHLHQREEHCTLRTVDRNRRDVHCLQQNGDRDQRDVDRDWRVDD